MRNAAANGIGNARFVTADLTASDWSFYRERWDVVVLDPPRTGAEAPVAEMHSASRAESSTYRATRRRSHATRKCWWSGTGLSCGRHAFSTCFRTRITSNPSRYSTRD